MQCTGYLLADAVSYQRAPVSGFVKSDPCSHLARALRSSHLEPAVRKAKYCGHPAALPLQPVSRSPGLAEPGSCTQSAVSPTASEGEYCGGADIVEIKHVMLPPSPREFRDIFVVFELMETDLHQVRKRSITT